MGLGVAGSIAAVGAAASVASSAASIFGGSKASGGAGAGAGLSLQQQQANAKLNEPFIDAGYDATNGLRAGNSWEFQDTPDYLGMAAASVPNANTVAGVRDTPGYQFNLGQGLQAVQNAASARGLGVSGAALKGAASYATGLADSTYQNQFSNQQTRMQDYLNLNTGTQGNVMNRYNRLIGTATLGANAANGVATNNTNAANSAGNYLSQGGAASAAGISGAGNAIAGGVNSYMQYNALSNLRNGGGSVYNNNTPEYSGPMWNQD